MWEYGKGEGDGLNQNRPRRATRTAALRRAAGDRAGYLVTGRGGGGAYAELSFRTTTGPVSESTCTDCTRASSFVETSE